MKHINLKEYYPFYTTDTIVEVPDEVADILRAYKLRDEAYRIYTYRHKAYFSLDFGDGIEYEALVDQKSPADIYEQHRVTEMIYKGLATLSEKQRLRIYAHYFLGMSQTEIARVENCSKISVHQSINRGLKQLQEYFLKNNFGRYKIIDKNKNVLYETSAKEFTVKLLFVVSVFIELLLICIFLKSNDVFKTAESKFNNL